MKKRQYTAPSLTDIARDLIKLYAKRRREKGYAFSMLQISIDHEAQSTFNDNGQENWDESCGNLFGSW